MIISTFGKGNSTSSIFPCRSVILSDIPLTSTISRAFSMIVDISTPITCLAPALTANLSCQYSLKNGNGKRTNMDRMAVPHPTSRTILSLKRCLFWTIAFMYDRVRTSSFWSRSVYSLRRNGSRIACTHQHFFVNTLNSRLAEFYHIQSIIAYHGDYSYQRISRC